MHLLSLSNRLSLNLSPQLQLYKKTGDETVVISYIGLFPIHIFLFSYISSFPFHVFVFSYISWFPIHIYDQRRRVCWEQLTVFPIIKQEG